MSEAHEDDLEEGTWQAACRIRVAEYLKDQGVVHGRIGEGPAWSVPCVVSLWAVESVRAPGWVGWWVLCGDGPTDYVSSQDVRSPREAVRALAQRWRSVSAFLERDEDPPDFRVGSADTRLQLAPLLASRADVLLQWVGDDSIWRED